MTDDELLAEYKTRHAISLRSLAARLTDHLVSSLAGMPRIDRVSARAKTPQRFLGKAQKLNTDGSRKYSDPLDQVQDQIGARVIVFYLKDVEAISATIERYYTRIERKDLVPESLHEFGYVGKHYILTLPEDVFDDGADRDRLPRFFELQVKTLFQHAWSEAEHDLGYKPEEPLTALQTRQVAFTAAQAWGADQIFATLHAELGAQPH